MSIGSLIALLLELWNTRATASPLQADWALATTHNRIADKLAEVTGQGQTIRIVLDDGPPITFFVAPQWGARPPELA
jgi:hypothetical protein